jgi:hypothetical protein
MMPRGPHLAADSSARVARGTGPFVFAYVLVGDRRLHTQVLACINNQCAR